MHYHVTENTPGYLPDADDAPRFDVEAEAVAYVTEQAGTLVEDIEDAGATAHVSGLGTGYVLVNRSDRMHDLGRVIAVDGCVENCPTD